MPKIIVIVVAAFLAFGPSAEAHKLSLFAMAEGTEIVGKVTPAGASVHVEAPDGTLLGRLSVDEGGAFRFQATQLMDHVVVADIGDGHAERIAVHWENLSDTLPKSSGQISVEGDEPHEHAETGKTEQAVARQVGQLRQELAAFRDEIRFRDIIGAIGYIIGFAGLLAWFHTRRKKTGK